MELHLALADQIDVLGSELGTHNSVQRDLVASRDMAGLERELCEYIGVPHCVSVDSATTGMLLALRAAGIETGDAVLCTSFSYFAIADIIELAGGRPMFVDINPNSYSIDTYCLEYVIGRCARQRKPVPKVLIAVDLFGLPCKYDAVEEICERHGIILIEDMAQSFGAAYNGKRTGGFGRMAVASFFPSRPLSELGEGGAVFCHTREDMRRLQSLRRNIHIGGEHSRGSYLDTVQADVIYGKLSGFDLELERRREVAKRYIERLEGHVKLQLTGEGCESACTQFVVSMKNARLREEMLEYLQSRHIPCTVFEPSPVARRDSSSLDKVALVNAESMAQRIFSLPIHPYLSRRIVDYICDQLLEGLEKFSGDNP